MSATTTDETTETTDLNTPDKTIRLLVSGGNADERYPVPSKQRFKDEGEGVIEADDLARIATALIRDDTLPLGHLASLSIAYLFAEKGGTTGGYPCLGRCIKASKVLRHFGDMDYVVLLSADNLREMKATRWQVEALVAHQLGHISLETTEKGEDRLGVQGHDFEGFTWEFARYGAYLAGMVAPAQAAASAVQMGLVFEESEDDEEFDPAVDQAPGVEGELGPSPDGPGHPKGHAAWAEEPDGVDLSFPIGHDEFMGASYDPAADFGNGYRGEDDPEEHAAAVRAAFPTEQRDFGEVCKLCGTDIYDHDPEVCQGGTPETRSRKIARNSPKNRSGANGAVSEESGTTSESPVLGHYSASDVHHANGTNGVHGLDGLTYDADTVMAALTDLGWSIAYEVEAGATTGRYVNRETGAPYDTGDVESSYRSALAKRS